MPRVLIVEDRQALAELIAASLEKAGFRTEVAHTVKEAKRRIGAAPPDAVILELLLPDAFGFEVARRLREVRPHAAVIALSGAFSEDPAVRESLESGLLDAFLEKPFRLDEVVAQLCARLGPVTDPAPPTAPWSEAGADSLRRVRKDLAQALAASPVEGTTGDFSFDPPEDGLAAAVAETAEALFDAPFDTGDDDLVVGDLTERSLPRLINAFYLGGKSGELTVSRGRVVKMVFFQDGVPAFAASNLKADRFDTRLLERGELDAAAIASAAEAAERTGRRIDRILVERGVLSASARRRLVEEQVKAIVYSLFTWQEGRYRITFQDLAREEPVRLGVFPAELILDGVAALPLADLERVLPETLRLAPSPTPAYELYQLPLSGDQAMLVARLDGTRTVRDLVEEEWLPQIETRALLYGLLCLEVVEDASLLIL